MTNLVTLSEAASHCVLIMDDGKANALSFEMLAQLNAALDTAATMGKVLVVQGRPGKFSAGFDLAIMGQGGGAMRDLLLAGAQFSRRLLDFPTPVVLGVSGHALAMGALLLLSADYRIGVTGSYKIGLNEVAIGMTLPYFGIALARERLAPTHVGRAVTLARIYDPLEAVQAGFLDEAVDESAFAAQVNVIASQLSALDMKAYRETKARNREALNASLDGAFERELGAVE